MNSAEFAKTIDELHQRLKSLTASKGEEYKRREDNQFANFERGALALGLTREQVLMVYLSKHIDSITTWVKDLSRGENREYAEPISGRIDDAILYLLLLRGMATCPRLSVPKPFQVNVAQDLGVLPPDADPVNRNQPATYILSRSQRVGAAECKLRDLPIATHCLSAIDQLYGIKPGSHIIFVRSGSVWDDQLMGELKEKAYQCGFIVSSMDCPKAEDVSDA
ncbi:MAG: hypothetical protein DDT26_00013 [Dehalococcoidia bacterium]|nr:hypothetical protein [Chloroflexota bacterium]